MAVDWPVVSWVTGDHGLSGLGAALPDVVASDVGAPQGSVLCPFPFTGCTSDFRSYSGWAHLQKFSDDSALAANWTPGKLW